MNRKKNLREMLTMIRDEGFTISDVTQAPGGSSHYKVKATINDTDHLFIAHSSGSDFRSRKNFRTELRHAKAGQRPTRKGGVGA
jgi:hypothetical protein